MPHEKMPFLSHLEELRKRLIASLIAIGVGFAVVFGQAVNGIGSGLRAGLQYGGGWWLLGPLTLMPLFLGMGLGVNWNAAAAVTMLPSLVGHLMYGTILGTSFAWLRERSRDYATAPIS